MNKYQISKLFTIIIITIFFSSCFKQRTLNELENQQITTYIDDLGLFFEVLPSGVYFHTTYDGFGQTFDKYDQVTLLYTGYNLDKKTIFAQNDTFQFTVGNHEILKGWNDAVYQLADGGSGILIFPYDKAFKTYQTPGNPAYSTLVYTFRILSDNYRTIQNALYFEYAEKYDSIANFFEDSLYYVKHFDGAGNIVDKNNVAIDYSLYTLEDSLITDADSFFVDFANQNITTGLLEGIGQMYQGEMGKIIIPPSLSYTDDNIYNLKPYTPLYAEVRIIADSPNINQESIINKYLYLNKVSPDSILPSNIYYFADNNETDSIPFATFGKTITYSDSLFLINHKNAISGCDSCTKILNNSNFFSGQIESIKLMRKGEKASFIIPYQQAYGNTAHGFIPPYSTLVYKVEIIDIQ